MGCLAISSGGLGIRRKLVRRDWHSADGRLRIVWWEPRQSARGGPGLGKPCQDTVVDFLKPLLQDKIDFWRPLRRLWRGGVSREQKILKGHLPRVIFHPVYQRTKIDDFITNLKEGPRVINEKPPWQTTCWPSLSPSLSLDITHSHSHSHSHTTKVNVHTHPSTYSLF